MTKKISFFKIVRFSLILTSLVVSSTSIYATNGFISHCVGLSCGTGGAGVTSPTDATNAHLNPSLLARLPSQFAIYAGIFHSHRTMNTTGAPLGNNVGRQTSKNENYPEGSLGGIYRYSEKITFGISLADNGGMATKYRKPRSNPLA